MFFSSFYTHVGNGCFCESFHPLPGTGNDLKASYFHRVMVLHCDGSVAMYRGAGFICTAARPFNSIIEVKKKHCCVFEDELIVTEERQDFRQVLVKVVDDGTDGGLEAFFCGVFQSNTLNGLQCTWRLSSKQMLDLERKWESVWQNQLAQKRSVIVTFHNWFKRSLYLQHKEQWSNKSFTSVKVLKPHNGNTQF